MLKHYWRIRFGKIWNQNQQKRHFVAPKIINQPTKFNFNLSGIVQRQK